MEDQERCADLLIEAGSDVSFRYMYDTFLYIELVSYPSIERSSIFVMFNRILLACLLLTF